MPSLGIHLLVMEQLANRLRNSTVPVEQAFSPYVDAHPGYAAFGAIGPDLFYYYYDGPRKAGIVSDIFNGMNGISRVLNDAANVANDVGLPNFADRVRQIADTAQLLVGTFESLLLTALIDLSDLITGNYLFTPTENQREKPENEWKWGDLLHDRTSGIAATMFLRRAQAARDPRWLAYSCGYYAHLATDVTGHAYVNQVVGGPARGFFMRHAIAEKFMDAQVFKINGSDINTSRLHTRIQPLHNTTELEGLLQMLVDELNGMVASGTMPFPLPSAPSQHDLHEGFEAMYRLFRLVTEDSYVPPPSAPAILIPPLPGQYGSITSAIGGLRPPGSQPKTLTDFLKLLLYVLLLAPAIVADLTRFIADIIAGIITYPLAIALYLLQSFLYRIYRQIRWFLVVSGVAFPALDELTSPLAQQFITCRALTGDDPYPRRPPAVNAWRERWETLNRVFEFDASDLPYLNYPATHGELPSTKPSVYPAGVSPTYFMNQLGIDPSFVAGWQAVTTPADLRRLVQSTPSPSGPHPVAGLGNALSLAALYLSDPSLAEKVNVDSDRGYAYREWTSSGGVTAGDIQNERFL